MNPNYGKEGNKGYKHTQKHLDYISEKLTGRHLSKEHCLNIGKFKTGIKQSIETIQHRVSKNEKQYWVIDPCGVRWLIKGMQQFCDKNTLRASAMINVAAGRKKSHRRWQCIYA